MLSQTVGKIFYVLWGYSSCSACRDDIRTDAKPRAAVLETLMSGVSGDKGMRLGKSRPNRFVLGLHQESRLQRRRLRRGLTAHRRALKELPYIHIGRRANAI